ncbi:MAG: magnesium transporter CorA family protein [Candidatus Taylorbacteria bacterium]|nr:magnesium transporter CorA family protein [Candidatus Taylorbacteria bacterium]
MTTTHTYRGVVWIDIESPEDNEISDVVRRYGLHPLVGEELRTPSTIAKISSYKEYTLVVLNLPVRTKQDDGYAIVDREIDFVIGKNFLITCRYEAIDQLEYFAKISEANSILEKNEKIEHAGNLFYYMMKRIYEGMFDDLENIKDSLLNTESRIFSGDERKMVETLSFLSRELIDFKQTARVHRDIWDDMIDSADSTFFGKDFVPYIRDIRDEFIRIHELINNCHELLADLRETNDSLVNTKQNDIIKILTLVAFIFYPLTFITAVFTMPSPYTPIIFSPQGWNIIVIGMAILAGLMWWYFKRKKWI